MGRGGDSPNTLVKIFSGIFSKRISIFDILTGKAASVEANGGLAVNIQDQTSPAFDLYFIRGTAAPTTIASQVSVGDTTIEVVSTANIIIGTYVGIFCPAEGRFFFSTVLSVASPNITVDTPADFAFNIGDQVQPTTRDMHNVVGTLLAPVIFEVQGAGSGDLEIDITRLMFSIVCSSQPDDSLFAGIAALINGIVIRRKDGSYRNYANIKANGDFANLAFDIVYTNRTTPASTFGVRVRWSFAGQDKHGVAIRLAAGESLQILIQDDLTVDTQDILSFRAIAVGHEVTD